MTRPTQRNIKELFDFSDLAVCGSATCFIALTKCRYAMAIGSELLIICSTETRSVVRNSNESRKSKYLQ